MREEESALSFAEFEAPGRPYTAPAIEPDSDDPSQVVDLAGGPPGTRTRNQRVKSREAAQEVTRAYIWWLATACDGVHRAVA